MTSFRSSLVFILLILTSLSSFSFQIKKSSTIAKLCNQHTIYHAKLSRKAFVGSSVVFSSDYNGKYLKNSKKDDIDLTKYESVRIPEFGETSTADVILNTATAVGGAIGGLLLGGLFEGYAAEFVGAAIASWLPAIGLIFAGRPPSTISMI